MYRNIGGGFESLISDSSLSPSPTYFCWLVLLEYTFDLDHRMTAKGFL
jgi:hypothetical protein